MDHSLEIIHCILIGNTIFYKYKSRSIMSVNKISNTIAICCATLVLLASVTASAQIWKPYNLRVSTKVTAIWMHNRITVDGITWVFNKPHITGQFANGDWWVLGPVTIDSINPPFDGENNGWEVNPVVSGGQGFQSGCQGNGFTPSLVPPLPYNADPSKGIISIVKTTPTGDDQPCIKNAVVLTVVSAIPPGNGAMVFRPPYVGTDKPYFYIDDIRSDLLPKYNSVTPMPTLDSIKERFSRLQMDHKSGSLGRALRPQASMANYQPENTLAQNDAVLRFMINEPYENKKQALVNFLQFGIDKIYTVYEGQTWPDGGGHQPGHLVVLSFTAILLNIDNAKQLLDTATFFHGSRYFYKGINGLTLWGGDVDAMVYWKYVMGLSTMRSAKDPYETIDGAYLPRLEYQHITAQSHKGEILATYLMPLLVEAWPKQERIQQMNYVDRWVLHGVWAQPDPFSPFDGDTSNFGITYGTDPDNPTTGIAGRGRFPANHGDHTDGGQYKSPFVAAMWNAYRKTVDVADTVRPFAILIDPLNEDTLRGSGKTLSATSFGIHGVTDLVLYINGLASSISFTKSSSGVNLWTATWNKSYGSGALKLSVQATDSKGNTFKSKEVSIFAVDD